MPNICSWLEETRCTKVVVLFFVCFLTRYCCIVLVIKVPFRVLPHFMHNVSVTSINAEANVHRADWLMSVFVNELAPPYVCSQQG